ncbi:MAG: hypothetical protein P8Y47_05440 [Alphaproteobacteria bacterium]
MARLVETKDRAPRLRAAAMVSAMTAILALGGCGGGGGGLLGSSPASKTEAPIALTPKGGGAQSTSSTLTGEIDKKELRKAIERYRIIKKRSVGRYKTAAADLNGDGRVEAIVIFSGDDWCKKTGCSLVVFQMERTGFRPVTHVTSAHAPVLVGPDSSYGWRDLIVKTGGGAAPIRKVRLAFTGKGYPRNALLQPEPTGEALSQSHVIMQENPAFSSSYN